MSITNNSINKSFSLFDDCTIINNGLDPKDGTLNGIIWKILYNALYTILQCSV
jgi:hypothetical protein